MITHSAGSASKVTFASFQRRLIVALCCVAFAAFFPRQSSAQQVTYYDFNTPAANSGLTSAACSPSSAAPGVLFCFNYTGNGLSFNQDNSYTTSIDPNETNGTAFALELTQSTTAQASSVWYSIPQNVASGFTAWYTFRISNLSAPPGDGLAFVIQNAVGGGAVDLASSCVEIGSGLTVLGGGGGCLGYGGIDNSIALEADTFPDSYDPWDSGVDSYYDNHIAMQDCGPGLVNSPAHYNSNLEPPTPDFVPTNCLVTLNDTNPPITYAIASNPSSSAGTGTVYVYDSAPHQVVIVYNGPNDSPKNYISVYLDPNFNPGTHTPAAGSTPIFSGTFDITQALNLNNGTAYIGFTGGTGGSYQQQEIMGFSFTPHSAANANVCPFGQTTPAPCSATIPVNFNIPAGTTISSVQVVTQGQNGWDFHDAITGDTCAGTYSTASSCTVNVIFAPLAPGLRVGAVNLLTGTAVIASQPVSGIGQGPEAVFSPLTTFVQSSGIQPLSVPMGVAVDVAGNVFVADTGNQQVEKIVGNASQIAAMGLSRPQGVAVDGAGNLYVADSQLGGTGEVVKLAPGCISSSCWSVLYTAQGPHPGPFGVAVDGSNNVFIADNPLGVFEIPANGSGQTLLYNPANSQPTGVAVDGAGDLFISDSGLHQVVEFPAGCGSSCQKTIGLGWADPASVAVDAAGDVIVADSGQDAVIEVPAGCTIQACQIVLAYPPFPSLAGTFQPFDAVPDSQGDIYIADVANNRIDVTLNEFQAFNFAESSVGSVSGDSPRSVLFQNIGNQTLNATAPGLVFIDPNFSQVPGGAERADCNASFSLVPGAACNLSVNYDPISAGSATGYANFYDNSLNNPASIQAFPFTGTGDPNGNENSLTVANGGPGNGTVIDNLTAINCILANGSASGTCSGSYAPGTPVTLTASPSGGASFLGWGGACTSSGTNSTCIVTMNAAQSVTAKFGQPSLGNINVCTLGGVGQPPCSSTQQITFTPTANVSNANIKVVTQGTTGLDFTLGGTTCGGTLTAGISCTITVNFMPQAPGLRLGAVEISGFANSVNGLVASIPISGIGQAPEIAYNPTAPAQVILGGGFSLSQPVAVDAAGNFYFVSNDQVYEKTSSGVQTLPSNGEFGGARSIAVDGAGDVFIADNEQGGVFELPANGGAQTTVYPPLHSFGDPSGVAVDGEGDLFVADSSQNEVVEISANGGSSTVLYGPTSGASVNSVAVDAAGDVFVALASPGSVVEIPAGCSSNSCQIPLGTGWNDPASLALDAAGNLYVADPKLASGNGEIVQVTPGCSSAACQYVLANGNTISGGVNAFSLALDGQGNVYYVNVGSNENGVGSHVAQLVEIAQSQVPSLNFGATTVAGTSSSPLPVTLQNIGNQPLSVGVFSVGSPFNQVFNGNDNPADCTNGGNFNLSPAQSCTASITFNPPAGEFYSADLVFTEDSLNTDFSPFQQIALSGTGTGGVVNYSLSASTAGTGSGSLGGTNCSTGSYPTGTTVTCTENPTGGSQFTGWSGGTCTGIGSCSFTLTANSTVVANFALFYSLTVSEIGSGTGTVTSSDNAITCASGSTTGCSSSYPSGTQVTLTASATGTSTFLGWGGACAASGTSATCNVTMNSALSVTASFAQQNFGNANVCPSGQSTPAPCSQSLTLTYNLAATTTLGATQVLTQGVGGLDFSLSSGGTCTGTITAGNSCTVNVNFAPIAPGLRRGAVSLYDNLGNLVATTPIYGIGQAPAIAFGPGTQITLATTLPANGLNQPYGLAVDAAGDVFIGEPGANLVQKLTPGGAQTTVGTFSGHPYGLAVDGAGNLFVADLNSNQIDKITPSGVQTVVPATGLTQPIAVAVDGAGNLFISDRNDNRVVKLTPSGVQTTLNTVGLNQPYGLAVDSADDVFIADYNNNRVIEVTPGGVQSTVPTAGLTHPYGVAVDAADDVFIVSFNDGRVIEVTPAGVQTTVPATGLSGASGVALDGAGDVFISDYNNYRVVEMQSSQLPSLVFALTNVSSTSTDSPQYVSIQNVGNQLLTGTLGLSLGANFGANVSSTCGTGFSLAPGASCSESFNFTPQTTGYLTGTASFSDNTLNLFSAVVLQTVNMAGEGGLNGQLVGVAVPNVVGLTQQAATAAIASAGLTMGTVNTAYSPIVSSGSVTASNPAAGTQVAAGSAVRLLVSTGLAPPPTPNPLSFENNYFLTGDYAAAGVTLRGTGQNGIATGTINIPDSSTTSGSQGVPDGADIIDGFLYWETLENTATPSGNNGTFLGFPISGQQVGSDQPFIDGTFNGTLRVYRADVNTYFPVATDGSGVRSGSGSFTVTLPDGGSTLPITEGASLVVLYRVLSPSFPLKSVVIYDGSTIPASSTSQNVLGFYDAVGGSSAAESTTLSYAPGGGWNNSFTSLSLPADATQYSAPLTSGNAYAAVIFSTPVKNSDNDGILDAWKTGPSSGDFYAGGPGYYDTKTGGWIPLPGAKHGQKDLFVQLDYMCGSVLPSGACDPSQENLFPSPDSNGNDPLAIVQNAFAANNVVLHLEIGNAVPEDTCADNTSTTPAQLCQFPGEQGVIGWKNSLEFSKLWPRNFASCAAGGDCSTRFPFGQKDSYHYVLFGHSLAIPAWNTRYDTLTSINVANFVTTIVTTDRGTGINACPSRITIAGVLGNPSLNGVYGNTTCPDTKTIVVATPGVTNWSYPNSTMPEPGIGLTSGTVTSISGYSDLGGADSAVTLGLWETAAGQDMSKRANVIAGTLFHEIGHTLGLTHGGLYYDSLPSYVPTFEANCKPNYQSSMNYLFQLDGVGSNAAVAFSNQTLTTIPDASLASVTQLTDLDSGSIGNFATFSTSSWYTSTPPSSTASAASLHCDGSPLTGDTGYRVNGNVDPISPAWTAGQNITFDGVSYSQLRGYNDEANIDLRQVGATGGELASLASVLSFGSSYSPLNVAAGGNVTLGAGGTVALGAGGTIALGAGGNATISSGSTITPAGGTVALNNGGSAILSTGGTITLGAGGNVTLGAGAAVRFGSAGTVSFGSGGGSVTLGAGGNVTLGAGGTISLVGGGNVTIPSTGGPYSYLIPPTGGTVNVNAGGTIALGAGGNVTLGAGGTIALGAGGNVTLGAGGNVTLGAGGTIALGAGGTIALGAGGNVTLGAGGTIALGAGGNVTMGAGGNVTLGAGGTVTLGAGGNVTLGAGGNVTLGAGGTVTLGAGGNVTLGAGGTITLGAGGNVTLGAGGTITSGGTSQTVTAGTYPVSAGGTVALGAGGNVTLGAGGTVTLGAGGNVTLGAGGTVALGAGGNVTLGAGGTIALGAGGNVTLGAGGESTSELTYLTANSVVRPPSLPTETPMPSETSVVVNWTAPAFGVVQTYTISRSSDGATPIVIGSVSGVGGNPPATTFTDTNPDFTSHTVVYTIGTTLLPVPIDPTPRQSPPSTPAVQTNNQTIVLGTLQSSVSISTSPLTVTATAESTGGAASGLQVNFSATGSCSIVSQAPPDSNGVSSASVALNSTGTCTITASQPGTNLLQPGNPPYYNAATPVSGTFNIQPAGSTTQSQTIVFPQLPTVQYGGTFSLSASSSVGLPVTFAASGPCTTSGTTLGVGLCTITATAQAGTVATVAYSAASVTQSFTIQPAVLTVTATSTAGTYGESSLPPLTYTTSPLVNGDLSTAVTGAPVLSTTATTASSPGNYPITVSTGTLAAANYSFLYVSGTLNIQAGSQTALTLNTTSPLAYNQSEPLSVTGGSSNGAVTYNVTAGSCAITGALLNQLTANSGNGSCSVTATMAGGGNYSPVTSAPANIVILQPANQSALTLITTTPLTYNQSEPLSVTGGNTNGAVTYKVTAGSCAITGALLNQLTANSGTGSCSVTATMAGNTNYNAVTSTPASIVNLQLASQAITFTSTVPSSAAFNSSFTVTATGGASGNPVIFSSSGSCSITGTTPGTATYTITSSTGTCSVIVNQAGNTNYSLAPPVTQIVNANGPAVTVSPSNINFGSVNLGSITTKTITVTNVGTAVVTINQPLLSIVQGGNSNEFVAVSLCPSSLAVGKNCTITIAFVAGPFYTPQTATLEIMDNAPGSPQPVTLSALVLTPQTITFTANPPASAAYKSSFTVLATGGASGNPVTFTSSGVCINSGATYTMTASTGTCSVIANQAGNSTYAAATQVTKTVTATVAPQAITFTQTAPSSAAYKTSFTVSATGGASGNAVTFTSSGSCTNSAGTYTMSKSTGTCSVIANQAGNSNYSAATQVTKTVTATLAPQAITFTKSAPSSAAYNTSFTVAATGGASGNSVTFTSSGACSNSGATYKMTSGTGTCSVIANQAGNSNYSAAAPVTQPVAATLVTQTIAFTTNPPSSAAYNTSFTVAATGGASGIAVIFTSSGACTNSGATYKMTAGTGTCSVIASQAGNSNYAAAAQVTKTVSATYSVATLGPATLSFGTVTNGRNSASQTATLSNTGTTPLVVSSIGFTGTNPGNFSQTNNCPGSSSSLAAGKSCTISVTFNSGGKAATASLTVTDNTQAGTQSVSLSGN
jgi:uncharacterized protein (DUF2345 family)